MFSLDSPPYFFSSRLLFVYVCIIFLYFYFVNNYFYFFSVFLRIL